MPSLGEDLGNAVRSGLCSVLAAGNAIEDFTRTVLNPQNPNYSYRARLIYSRYCTQPPPALPDDDFEGGQCEFCYTLTVTRNVVDPLNPGQNGEDTIGQSVYGPISFNGVRELDTTDPNKIYEGVFTTHGSCLEPRSEFPVETVITRDILSDQATVTVTNIVVTPIGGIPDECGNPPHQLPPDDPAGRQFPIDFDFTYDDGTDFDITGNVFFGFAYFDTDFNLNVPLKFTLENNVSFTGNFNFDSGDLNINFGDDYDFPTPKPPEGDYRPDPNGPPPPPSSEPLPPGLEPPYPPNEEPDAEDPEDFDDEQPQESPKFRRIVGVLVDTVQVPRTPTLLGQDVNPDVYVPDIGLVNFGYLIGGNRLYWGEDVRVKNRRQVIFTPEGRYAIDVRGTIRQGGQWVITPIYQQVAEGVGVPS